MKLVPNKAKRTVKLPDYYMPWMEFDSLNLFYDNGKIEWGFRLHKLKIAKGLGLWIISDSGQYVNVAKLAKIEICDKAVFIQRFF